MKKVRRYDIDWIRVIVFDILIIYHVGVFFVPWEWHLNNNEPVEWMIYPMWFVNQWRIPILFVVSGMGTRFALSYRSGGQYIKERISRLFIPLLFGIFIIVPPQVYLERIHQGVFEGSFLQFYPHIFDGIYPDGNFSWHHLWFLPYLLVMSMMATPLFLSLRRPGSVINKQVRRVMELHPSLIFAAVIPIAVFEFVLADQFPITHAFVGDWYCWIMYSFLFLTGYVLICNQETFWTTVRKIRRLSLMLGLTSFAAMVAIHLNDNAFGDHENLISPIIRSINMWSWILAVFGYAATHLNKESMIIKYRNKAVYPFYILHQTITILIGFYLIDHPMHYSLKFTIMTIGTFGVSWCIYELVIRRLRILWPLFGLKSG